jgi:hypothetical protein
MTTDVAAPPAAPAPEPDPDRRRAPAPRRVSVLDLTLDQLEAIESEIGLPVHRWPNTSSDAKLYGAILAAVEGVERSSLGTMTLRDLQRRVDLSGDSDPDR